MGSWAGIPYVCYSHLSLSCMFSPGLISTATLIEDADSLAAAGDIDPTENMAGSRYLLL